MSAWFKLEFEDAIFNVNDVIGYRIASFKLVGFPIIIPNNWLSSLRTKTNLFEVFFIFVFALMFDYLIRSNSDFAFNFCFDFVFK